MGNHLPWWVVFFAVIIVVFMFVGMATVGEYLYQHIRWAP